MKDVIKKSFLLGLGAASITKAKAEKIIKEIAKKSPMSAAESRQLVKKTLMAADNERKRMQALAEKEVNRIALKMGSASKNEIKKLRKRISALEKRLRAEGRKTAKKMLRRL
ncbi:hypothetical protein J4458_01630 [Candidatus Woesearchaeota archaeon]|nr:hypothetical protein [Candidatus Woesearchaeota archaeon]